MKRVWAVAVLAVGVVLALGGMPSYADGGHGWHGGHGGHEHGDHDGHWHGGVFIGVGPGWPYGWGPGWGPYGYWAYPPPYPYPPVVVQQPPQVYVERPAPEAQPEPGATWYYCQSAKAYYPYVGSCPEPWVKVPASPQ